MQWKTGFEIELLAPIGSSRADLAQRLAAETDGLAQRIFYPQSEPGMAPGIPVFENLVIGFDVTDRQGAPVARLVDDLTIRADLDREAAPAAGWMRILSDDPRFLSLVQHHCDPRAPIASVLDPLAGLFGTLPERAEADLVKVTDAMGRAVAIATGLPGERERPCELITPPFLDGQAGKLEFLLARARELGFTVPAEAARSVRRRASFRSRATPSPRSYIFARR